MPWYPKAVVGVVIAMAIVLALLRPLRQWVFRIDIRWLIGFHLIRFVGLYFLYLYARGELPYRFAVWGGWGDILVVTFALALLFFTTPMPLVVAWNLLGLADIIAVVASAARSEVAVPGSMHQLDQFPLILLPTLIVPMIIVTHILMLVRALRRGRRV